MANHSSAIKASRASETRRLRNRYRHKTTRTYMKKLRGITEKKDAEALFRRVASMLDKLAKVGIIHKNKAANQKAKLARFVGSM